MQQILPEIEAQAWSQGLSSWSADLCSPKRSEKVQYEVGIHTCYTYVIMYIYIYIIHIYIYMCIYIYVYLDMCIRVFGSLYPRVSCQIFQP